MPSAALLFMDVVKYSAGSIGVQYDTILALNRDVYYVLYSDFDPRNQQVIALPTGDGMLLALLDKDDSLRRDLLEKCFELLQSLRSWSDTKQIATLRYGLHYGAITLIRDINNQLNICGDAVNITARIMSLGQANHIVASSDFINHFVPEAGQDVGKWVEAAGFRIRAMEEVDTRVKHNRRIMGYNLVMEHDEMQIGNPEELDIKYYAEVRHPAISKERSRERTLPKILGDAEKVTFVGLAYPNLPALLEMLGDHCGEVLVCIPSDRAAKQAEQFFAGKVTPTTKKEMLTLLSGWRSSRQSSIVYKVYQYPHLPPFGALLAEWEDELRGFLHLSMYLPDIAPEDTPFMEIVWANTSKPPELYRFYLAYIRNLIAGWTEVVPD